MKILAPFAAGASTTGASTTGKERGKARAKEKGKDGREKGLGFSLGKDLLLLPWKMAEEQFEVAGGMAVDTRIQH